jgi:hypothetical protein
MLQKNGMLRYLFYGSFLCALAGCQSLPFTNVGKNSNQPAPKVQTASAIQSSIKRQGVNRPPTARSTPRELQDVTRFKSREAAVTQTVQLMGLDENEVTTLFGMPADTEDRPPSRIWRYGSGSCTLLIAFYPDVKSRVFKVLSYEVTNDGNTNPKQHCWQHVASSAVREQHGQ